MIILELSFRFIQIQFLRICISLLIELKMVWSNIIKLILKKVKIFKKKPKK